MRLFSDRAPVTADDVKEGLMTSRSLRSSMRCTFTSRALVAGVVFLIIAAAAAPADATARLWLYPDSDDPRAGGHVVNGDAFTLNVENVGGGGNGDNLGARRNKVNQVGSRQVSAGLVVGVEEVVSGDCGLAADGAQRGALELWVVIIDLVNSSFLPGSGGCDGEEASTRSSNQRRRAVHRP